eukprot:m.305489 g.305489  ORF g.305489 m.305489 type:complete len:78 (+) comp15907_c0_seq12:5222-5455(+)
MAVLSLIRCSRCCRRTVRNRESTSFLCCAHLVVSMVDAVSSHASISAVDGRHACGTGMIGATVMLCDHQQQQQQRQG